MIATKEEQEGQVREREVTRRDFVAPVDVRWCPGCGDYAILNTIQSVFPTLGVPRERFVVVSGIGCSSRFPYYMNTYGFHTIHGRAPAVATGVKLANLELSVWMITGDGDGLSIGGNHLMHLLRRNMDIKILLFNNKVYGLTKGQYSPTSELGFIKKSTPYGSIDYPMNPLHFALASQATFVARTYDTNPKHMTRIFKAAAAHKGTAFVEILQNCVIYNNKAWADIVAREVRDDALIDLRNGKPLVYGKEHNRGIRFNGFTPEIVELEDEGDTDELQVHTQTDPTVNYAYALAGMESPAYPLPIGVFRAIERPTYGEQAGLQARYATEKRGHRNLQSLLMGGDYWEVEDEEERIKVHQDPEARTDSLADEMDIIDERKAERENYTTDPLFSALATRISSLEVTYGTGRVISIEPGDSIGRAITLLKEYNLDCLLVVQKDKLKGIVTSRDILMKVALTDIDREKTPVREIMTPRPDRVEAWNSVGDAINKMSLGSFRHLPVDHNGQGYGMVSVQELLGYVYTSVKEKG
jgi:2-oxoglutarate ferredoxin oxidoreductase subunit beta